MKLVANKSERNYTDRQFVQTTAALWAMNDIDFFEFISRYGRTRLVTKLEPKFIGEKRDVLWSGKFNHVMSRFDLDKEGKIYERENHNIFPPDAIEKLLGYYELYCSK